LFLLISCNKNLYYVYEDGQDYTALEITPGKEILYRTTISPNISLGYDFVYAVIQERNDYYKSKDQIYIDLHASDIAGVYVEKGKPVVLDVKATSVSLNDPFIEYHMIGSDSIILVSKNERQPNLVFLHNKPEDPYVTGVFNLPEKMKRVKYIDYSRFPKSIQSIDLKMLRPRREAGEL